MKYTDSICSVSREIAGRNVTLKWYSDVDAEEPWACGDGHGPVSKWRHKDSKTPGEMILFSDRDQRLFYDFAEAVRIARRDGWDAEPFNQGTPGERAHRAAMADYENLRAWCNDEWQYVGYVISVNGEDYPEGLDCESAVWGIDSTSMDEFEKEAFANVEAFFAREDTARRDAACRDIVTV